MQNVKVEWLYHWPLTAFKAICQDLVIKLVVEPSSSPNRIDFNQNLSIWAKYQGRVAIPLAFDGFQGNLPGSGNQVGCGAQFILKWYRFQPKPFPGAKYQGRVAIPLVTDGFQKAILPGSGNQIGCGAQFIPKWYRFQPKPFSLGKISRSSGYTAGP